MKKTATKKVKIMANGNGQGASAERISVAKTYKIYIGGKFPRTESGRYYPLKDSAGQVIANICLGSRKDFRNAVVAARKAQGPWWGKSAFNRGQILYRIGEMLEGRSQQMIDELKQQGLTASAAKKEVELSVDRLIHYAGWCDKHVQIFSSVNPVASSHFNFSIPEPMGVVAAFAPETSGLLGLVSLIAPIVAAGNSCVVLASESMPLSAITFAEILHSSDVPGGVINILTGKQKEILWHAVSHMDVNAVVYAGDHAETITHIRKNSSVNMKRPIVYSDVNWSREEGQGPYYISDVQEIKTTWHPIEKIGGAGSGY